jgi:hypothetical protein
MLFMPWPQPSVLSVSVIVVSGNMA